VEVDRGMNTIGIKKDSIVFYSLGSECLLKVSEEIKNKILLRIRHGIEALSDSGKTVEYY
jgi:hypothetical protein